MRNARGTDLTLHAMTVRCPTCDRMLELPHGAVEAGAEFLDTLAAVECPHCGLVAVEPHLDPTVTYQQEHRKLARVGHFVPLRLLGQGSSGEVWLADDVNLGRKVALKLPRSYDPQSISLSFEAKTAANLNHPNIVSIYEIGVEGDQVFIASEFIDGMTLRDYLSAGKPTVARAIDLLQRISRALHYAHQQGIVHRDVKPANILLDREGQPYVTDFGIAKRLHADATISSEGQIIGTARYMSPEQAGGRTKETDHRADIYALGVMLFEMLTRDVPFRGNVRAILDQKITHDSPSPRTLDPSIPRDLETICLKCLEREPEKRYTSAQELVDELDRFTAGAPIRARPISRAERVWRWCRMRPAIAGLLVSLFLSLSLGLIGVTFFWRQAARSAEVSRQSLYRSQMNLASVHLSNGDTAGVREMLSRVASNPELAPLRGFEWYHYHGLTLPLVLVANHGDGVRDVAVSREGDVCATIGREKEIRVWDVRTGELVRTLAIDGGSFQSIDFSPTTRHLVSGSDDGFVRIWNPLEDGRVLRQVPHGPQIIKVGYSPDGNRVLSAGSSGAVRIWDAAAGTVLAEIPTGKKNGNTRDVRFSADGKKVIVAMEDGHLRVWDFEKYQTGSLPEQELDSNPTLETFAQSDDGRFLVTGDFHGRLTIQTAGSATSQVHKSVWGRIDDMEFLRGSQLLVVTANDGKLHFFDAERRRETRTLNAHGLSSGSLARSADGKSLVSGSGDGSVTLVKLNGLTTPTILWHNAPVRGLEFSADGQRVLAADDSGELRLWNLETGQPEPPGDLQKHSARAISRQPRGPLVAAAGTGPTVAVWDSESRSLARELEISRSGALAVRFCPSGRRLVVATRKGPIHIYNAQNWDQAPLDIPAREGKVTALACSPDDQLLAVANDAGHVEFFDLSRGEAQGPPVTMKSEPTTLEYCDGGRLLAVGTNVGEIHVWTVAPRELRMIIKGHTARINVMALLPGTQTLVSAGRDRQLKLWDVTSGELIAPLIGHQRQVFSIAVSHDGRTIVSGGLEGDIRVWNGTPN